MLTPVKEDIGDDHAKRKIFIDIDTKTASTTSSTKQLATDSQSPPGDLKKPAPQLPPRFQFKITETALLTPVKEEIADDHTKKEIKLDNDTKSAHTITSTKQPAPAPQFPAGDLKKPSLQPPPRIQFKVTEAALLTPVKEEIGDDHVKREIKIDNETKRPAPQPAPST